jgi:hypothetical protein
MAGSWESPQEQGVGGRHSPAIWGQAKARTSKSCELAAMRAQGLSAFSGEHRPRAELSVIAPLRNLGPNAVLRHDQPAFCGGTHGIGDAGGGGMIAVGFVPGGHGDGIDPQAAA